MLNNLKFMIFGKPQVKQEEIKEKENNKEVTVPDKITKPSIEFCKTGILPKDEKYNQDIHSYSPTIKGRAELFYTEEEIKKMIKEVELEESKFIFDMNNH